MPRRRAPNEPKCKHEWKKTGFDERGREKRHCTKCPNYKTLEEYEIDGKTHTLVTFFKPGPYTGCAAAYFSKIERSQIA